jgi:hypothetical protein
MIARLQALYYGALGERGQLSLLSYGNKTLQFDKNAHTMTSTYNDGHLRMYTISTAQSSGGSARPEYYMHLVGSWSMIASLEVFRQGAAAFRNARDWAQDERGDSIRRANTHDNAKDDSEVDDEDDEDDGGDDGKDSSSDDGPRLVKRQRR